MTDLDAPLELPGYGRRPAVSSLAVHAFDRGKGVWCEVATREDNVQLRTLRCVTFNTWFQGDAPELRYRGLLDVLERADADVIVLQEATVRLLERLQEADWVRARYRLARAPFRADAVPSHGVMLLSRLPICNARLHPLPTHMGRALLSAESRINDRSFVFATAHFESMKQNGDTRAEQLAAVFRILEGAADAMLAGDFNFCSSWTEENRRIDRRYLDTWSALRPDEPGFTQDTDINLMLAQAKGETKRVRFDRILLRSDARCWQPQAVELVGTAAVEAKFPRIFPSDHFGVCASFQVAR